MKNGINNFIVMSVLTISLLLVNTSYGQTDECDLSPGGEIVVGTDCIMTPFNTDTDNEYWNSIASGAGCGATDGDDKWVWFTATSDFTNISYYSDMNPVINLFEGAPCNPVMTSVACSNSLVWGTYENITYATTIGTVYHVRLQNNGGEWTMNGSICIYETSSTPVTASDCPQLVDICTDYSFQIDANGIGVLNEIPPSGSFGNPLNNNPGGTGASMGCLQGGEYNSTWLRVTISGSGDLEFIFGGLGTQNGYYDWIMYPYTSTSCTDIPANTVSPIRCNWNNASYGGTGLIGDGTGATTPAGGNTWNFEPALPVTVGDEYIIVFSNYSDVLTSVPIVFGGTATVECPVLLPVELLDFKAQAENEKVRLSWTTASELNNDYFEIERSYDGVNYNPIGKVKGMGNSSYYTDYLYKDDNPGGRLIYYRLKQVDYDGESEISKTVTVNLSHQTNKAVSIYPNPANQQFTIAYNSGQLSTSELRIEITNTVGNIALAKHYTVETYFEKIIDINDLKPGIYHINVISANGTKEVHKLVVNK